MTRTQKIQALMKEQQLDAILITSEVNCHYFCGFSPSEGMILMFPDGEGIHLVDSRYTVTARRHSQNSGLRVHETARSMLLDVKTFLEERGVHRLGIEDQALILSAYRRMEELLPQQLCPLGDSLSALRGCKEPEELEAMIHAQRIAEAALEELLNHIRPGKRERDLAVELNCLMLKKGAEDISFPTIFVSGENTSMPHGVPSERMIRDGDFVTIDFGAVWQGYHSDMTRTVAVGHVSDEMQTVYETVLKAQLAALEAIRVGFGCRELFYTAFDIIEAAGYGPYFRHGLGHGLGLEIHEGYSSAPNSTASYEDGYVTSVEPGIYLPERFGVRIEDVVCVRRGGVLNLMNLPKELLIL